MSKREVPSLCQQIMAVDVLLTDKFCSFCEQYIPAISMKTHYKALEYSCHGVPWLVGWLAFTLMTASDIAMKVNLYIGLILDIIIVGLIKAIVRRRRPVLNKSDMFATMGPDKFSFPSGHATRSVYVAFFFTSLWPLPAIFKPSLFAWAAAVCTSRVLLRRHHLLDVAAGVAVGIFEGLLVSWLWCDDETSGSILSWITSESYGGEYHV